MIWMLAETGSSPRTYGNFGGENDDELPVTATMQFMGYPWIPYVQTNANLKPRNILH